MSKTYNCAPLPFIGQKRYFIKDFKEILKRSEDEIDTVVDLFGGSGLLSHTAKRLLPGCRVIYNDFDRYIDRLKAIEQTNEILGEIKEILIGLDPGLRLNERQRMDVLEIISKFLKLDGWIDIQTIGRNLLFSGKWSSSMDELIKHAMYNRVKSGKYECDGYLDGLEVVHMDYRELFEQERHNSRVLFLIDPPYLSTECAQYGNYWKLTDYLDVLRLLNGTKWIYFTSDKSQILEFCQWLENCFGEAAPMCVANVRQRTNTLNYNAKFKEMMIYNCLEPE